MRRWILLVDPEIKGHHGTYLRLISQSFLRLGYHVCVLSGAYPAWSQDGASAHGHRLRVEHIAERTFSHIRSKRVRRIVRGFFRWATLEWTVARLSQRLRGTIDLVFLAFLDGYLTPFPFHLFQCLLPVPWSGLYVSPKEASPNRKGHYVPIGRILQKKKCRGVLTLVHTVADTYKRTSGKIAWLPDISDNSLKNQRYRSVEAIAPLLDRTVVGLVGAIAKRKAVVQLLSAAELAQKQEQPIAFVVAGNFERDSFSLDELQYLKQVRVKLRNLVWWPYFIPEEAEFNAIVRSCDVLFAAYPDFYMSSNMLAKAGAFGKNVLALKGYYLGTLTEQYGLGVTIPELSPGNILSAIIEIARKIDIRQSAKRSIFLKLYSNEAFDLALSTILSPRFAKERTSPG